MKFKRINESRSYGGAFDIADDQLFSRDELNEFGYSVVDALEDKGYKGIDYAGCWVDDKTLTLMVQYEDYEVEASTIIDYRKLNKAGNLSTALFNNYANRLMSQIENELKENGVSMNEGWEGKFENKYIPERKYFINGEEVERDDFYDAIVSTSVTTQQMIDLENNHNKDNPIEIEGDTYFIEQEPREEEKKVEGNKNIYTSLTESFEDGIINLVVFKNNSSGFYDSIDYFDEEEAKNKVEELLQFPGRYSNVKTVRMTKNNQAKFLKNEEEQDKFMEDGNVPDKYIEEVILPDDEPIEQETTEEEEVISDDEDISLNAGETEAEPVEEVEAKEEIKEESFNTVGQVPAYILEELRSQPEPTPHV